MVREPLSGQTHDRLKSAGFLEQMARARHDFQRLFAAELRQRRPIEGQYRVVVAPDNQQGGTDDARERSGGEVRSSTAGDDGRNRSPRLGRGDESRRRARARPEISHR